MKHKVGDPPYAGGWNSLMPIYGAVAMNNIIFLQLFDIMYNIFPIMW